ncbi:MAG: translocation/assembly module TamB domain-containing protein, partial [Chitinispirillaceae bacterium]|nr:translocation/assembly module TamB domain-containing protein [Chitinispirillaceae bacterium]
CRIITSPIDLVADRISGLSDAEKNGFRGRLTFLVYLKLRGALLHPDITFELQLPPEDKGALGGAVDAKLMQLNADPSSLDKQVFALLVLGRFLQENPIESSSGPGSVSSVARSGVSSFLSGQLQQWGAAALPGLELNLGIQSYDDFTSGEGSGRTQVEIGVRKQLFNDRLSVQVGGAVDVEGARAQRNTANDIIGDVVVEYKLTSDGRYRLKGFRKNIYEDPLDGQLIKTAVGISMTRIFNKWKNLFRKSRNGETTKNVP